MDPAEVDSLSPCIAAATRAASRRLTQLYDEIMAPSGLRMTQYHLLCEIGRRASEPPTVGELAAILAMERSALGQTLKPLEREGMVALHRDERDGRRRPIALTETGERAVRSARPYWAKAHKAFETYFGADALAQLRSTLHGIAMDPDLSLAFGQEADPGATNS